MKMISVTRALGVYSDFSMIPPHVLEMAALRGTDVHMACASYALGLFIPRMESDRQGFFQSFKSWFDSYVLNVFYVEAEFINEVFGYLGHVDLVCELIDHRFLVVDYKTPVTEAPTWKSQLAAYKDVVDIRMIKDHGRPTDGSMSLQLNKEGKPAKAITYQYQDADFAAFLSALNAYRYFKK